MDTVSQLCVEPVSVVPVNFGVSADLYAALEFLESREVSSKSGYYPVYMSRHS